ncbi:MAG: DMT family transporter [Verrucomicrobia bacterium]|jgi:drug/metabolite transporter (DMT)-like permease|nr:MAG: DMT family transporter [Verrucomicrobiota bacterium]MDH4470262.1 DMT family transporter [Verrucomicrobiae bacterium]
MLKIISQKWLLRISFWVTVFGWGWGWVGIKDELHYFNPGQLSLGRYSIASLALLPFFVWKVKKYPQISDLPLLLLMGLLGFTFYNLFITFGEKTIAAGEAALIGSSLPILTALGATFFFKEYLSLQGWMGVLIAFFGISFMSLKGGHGVQLSSGALLVFAGIVCGSLYALLVKKTLFYYSPIEVTAWTLWIGTLGFIPFGGGIFSALAHAPPHALVTMLFLGIVTGALCYICFIFLTAHLPIAQVANVKFFIPVASVILGWLLLGEIPSWMILLGGAITLSGASLVHYQKK